MEKKEVMLHLPMEPLSDKPMGPGGLSLNMTEHEFLTQLKNNILAVPFAIGINNHMGSLLTRHPGHMLWLMQELKRQGSIYFVDSRTHAGSVAAKIASENLIPNASRDIFLDNDLNFEIIEKQFRHLLKRAKKQGYALAIGHPHRETLMMLEHWLPILADYGVELIPVSKYIQATQQRNKLWHASLSRSHKAAKN